MDDPFLRTAAALQANLALLDAQSDAFTEFSDMQVLRQIKSRLADYIAGHAAKGDLPPDPLRVIKGRLEVVARFFAEADKASSQILEWNKNWLKSIPEVGIDELQAAKVELEALVAGLPLLQEQLRQQIIPLDWDAATSDLHPELLLCAECCGEVKLPKDAKTRGGLHGFAHGTGNLARRVERHLAAMAGRIRELVALREEHLNKIRIAESLITAHDFRSASAVLDSMEQKFTNVPYKPVVQANAKLLAKYGAIVTLERTLEEKFKTGGWKGLTKDFAQLEAGIDQPNSELGRECLALLASMESQLAAFLAARRSRRMKTTAILALAVLVVLATAGGLIVLNEQAEKARIEAVAQAEREKVAKVAQAIPRLEKSIATKDAFGAEDALAELEALIPDDVRLTGWSGQVAAVPGTTRIVDLGGGVTMDLVLISSGTFTMGSDKGGNERAHQVTLTKPFYLGKTEVTQEQWQQVMGGNPSEFKDAKNPVENVSWDDCQEFVVKLRKKVPGQTFRLPTEAEWEYACRAGTTGDYAGNLDDMAWYDDNSGSKTHPVGQKKPNAWGLYDMHGNVWEWCADWYGDDPHGAVTDPTGPNTGSARVGRGGSWYRDGSGCRSANRRRSTPGIRNRNLGFRVAAVPVGP
ncbi:MAG: formylglycine-generating enzyme family protein [Verrucomicrobiota bacterium]